MSVRSRLLAPVCLVAAILAGCGSATPASSTAAPAVSTATPAQDSELLVEYIAGICPVFDALVVVDPRLNELRETAANGGDMAAEQDSIDALSDDILVMINALEALPAWEPGAGLRFQLMNSLHGVRTRLLNVSRDPSAPGAAALIEEMPFIATDALDRAMGIASQGGLVCESAL